MRQPRDSRSYFPPIESSDDEAEAGSIAINPVGLPLPELVKLKDRFRDAEGQQTKLTLDQFVSALSANLPPAETQAQADQWHSELATLFKKIDASCTETVNWEEFTNYMLLHMPDLTVGDGACELSHNAQTSDALTGAWGSGHTDMINCITVIPDLGVGNSTSSAAAGAGGSLRRYVTAGRDGFLKVWFPNLTLQRAIDVGQRRSWLSACCWMPKSRYLAVASSRGRIYFYDASFNPTPIAHIKHDEGTPLCLAYTEPSYESDERVKEILMVGDINGYVTVYPMDDDWTDQESKGSAEPIKLKSKASRQHTQDWADQEAKIEGCRHLAFKTKTRQHYHDDWVTKVGFVSELQAMVTCGLDGKINLCDLHINRRKQGRDPIRLHKKGVHSWCWCGIHKWFASGGLDRQIIVWNPYTQRAITSLQGHNAPILDVLVNEREQLISMSVDKVVKVWDIRNYRCIQTFTDKTKYEPEDRLTCMAFDEDGPALVMCSSTVNVLPVNVKVETSRTHLAPIVGALYNDVFHQVISGDNLGTVCVWDVRTGKLEFEFRRAHQDYKLTCMAFDESKRRLYTGGEDGTVKLWNFSSGQALRSYTMKQPSEITGIFWAREGPNIFVVGLAWDRRIYVWPDRSRASVEPQYVLEDSTGDGHTGDITCIARHSVVNGLLATGGEDGYVVFWKIQETSSASASARRYRLSDTAPMGPQRSEQKTGPQEARIPRTRRRHGGKVLASLTLEESAAVNSTALGALAKDSGGGPISGFGKPANGDATSSTNQEGTAPFGAENHERSGSSGWPAELGFEGDHVGMVAAGVERMIHLEHKGCLLTMHSDGRARLWSTKTPELLTVGGVELLATAPTGESVAAAKTVAVTSLYADSAENKWLFTGDAEGYVQTWDLTVLRPGRGQQWPQHLLQLQGFRPHQQSVTHLQHFELDGHVVVMSASSDCTIVLSSIEGDRLGTFSSKGPHWHLAEKSAWHTSLPQLDEGSHASEGEDGWSLSPRRATGRQVARAQAGTAGGGGVVGMVRTPRAAQLHTRPAAAPQAHCRPQHLQLNADKFRPDMSLVEHEKQWLAKQPNRLETQ